MHHRGAKFAPYTYNNNNNNERENSVHAHAHTHEGEGEIKKETEQPNVENPIITTGSNLKKVEEVAAEFFAEVGGETQTAERFERLYHLPRSKIAEAVPIFRDTLLADGIDFKSIGDFRRHFNSWLKLNANRIFNDLKTNGQRTYDNARDNDAYLASLMDDLRTAFAGGDVQ